VSGDLLEVTGQCNGEYDMGLAGPLTVRGGRGADSAEPSGYVGLDAVRLSRVTISDARQVSTKGTTVLARVKITRSGSECVHALKNFGGELLIRHSTIARNPQAGGVINTGGGRLTAGDVRVVHNDARCVHSFGGGIINDRGKVFLDDVLVANNKANYGGGIQNNREMEITNSRISDNVARFTIGGGILNDGQLTLTSSEVTGNRAGEAGGGIYNRGAATLVDTVVTDNQPDDCFGVEC